MSKYNLEQVLEALVDEVKDSGNPSELTVDILESFEDEFDFIKDYFKEFDKRND